MSKYPVPIAHVYLWLGMSWSRSDLPENVMKQHEKTCVNPSCPLLKKNKYRGTKMLSAMDLVIREWI